MTTNNEPVIKQNVWSHYLSARQARKVAKALKEAGYSTATYENCTEYVVNVAEYFEPGDPEAQRALLRLICQAAGIQPNLTPDERRRRLLNNER